MCHDGSMSEEKVEENDVLNKKYELHHSGFVYLFFIKS